MSSSAAASATASGSNNNLSDALASATATATASASASGSGSQSGSGSASASGSSGSASASKTAAASNTLTDAPNLSTSSASVSSLSGAPSLTSGNIPKLTDLPTLSGFYSYPPPSVPPMANAPYLQKGNLPQNFVFIIVGSVIAFVALLIIAWRVLTSWSINRRFRRHDGGIATGHGRASYTPLADFKQKPAAVSSHDMKDLGNLPKNFSSVPSLFFSPTAEVARHSMRPSTARSESYGHLPPGHYRDASRN